MSSKCSVFHVTSVEKTAGLQTGAKKLVGGGECWKALMERRVSRDGIYLRRVNWG
jgi:hypothetical protein